MNKEIKISSILCFLFLLICTSTKAQEVFEATTVFNSELNWTIIIPKYYTEVSPADWAKMQNQGMDAIEDTYDVDLQNNSKTIFVFQNGKFNHIESSIQPYNAEVEGDFLESCIAINGILFKTIKTQMPDLRVDSTSSVEIISGLEFQAFHIKIHFPNGMEMHTLMYSRLFDIKRFSLSISYIDKVKGKQMIESWKSSKFR